MAEMQMWSVFAYFHGDEDGERDRYSEIPEWRLADTIRWAKTRGYDAILLSRLEETREFRPSVRPLLEHNVG